MALLLRASCYGVRPILAPPPPRFHREARHAVNSDGDPPLPMPPPEQRIAPAKPVARSGQRHWLFGDGALLPCRPMTSFGIGAPVRRREDFRLLTGAGPLRRRRNAPGQAHAAFVRSPHAHADVLAIDPAPARATAGVLGVFTGRDLVADGVGAIPTLIPERAGGIEAATGRPSRSRRGTRSRPTACVTSASPSRSSSRRRPRRRRTARSRGRRYAVRPLSSTPRRPRRRLAPLHAGVARNRPTTGSAATPRPPRAPSPPPRTSPA